VGHGKGVLAVKKSVCDLPQNGDPANEHVPHEHLAHVRLLLGQHQPGSNQTHDHAHNGDGANDLKKGFK